MVFGLFQKNRRPKSSKRQPTQAAVDRRYSVGDIIAGKYEVEKIFEGGLGRVYVVSFGQDRLVLKTIKGHPNESERRAFEVEARTWIGLGRHPNIVTARWVDELAGMLCIAADLVEPDALGRTTLREVLAGPKPTLQQIVRWAAEFCYGLQFARENGLKAHRDIKPENLLIGRSGNLQITDFGIASSLPQEIEGFDIGLSGTPPYMAPEQWLNQKQSIQTDIYAFGCILFEMSFGQPPFIERSPRDLFLAHTKQSPRTPQHPLSNLIALCLSKQPSGRPSGAEGLLRELNRVAERERLFLPPKPIDIDDDTEDLPATFMPPYRVKAA